MNKLQYIVVHCLLTPKGRWITKGDLQMWHLGPRNLKDGKVKFMGVEYKSREQLPLTKINGVLVSKLHGRGWDRLGYADMIHHNGDIENLTPYDKDDYVDSEEITWGAVGVNSISRHVALEGGMTAAGATQGHWKFEELYTDEQFVMLASYLNQAVKDYPWVKVIGHYQVPQTSKSCPNFHVPTFCKDIALPEENYENVFKINV